MDWAFETGRIVATYSFVVFLLAIAFNRFTTRRASTLRKLGRSVVVFRGRDFILNTGSPLRVQRKRPGQTRGEVAVHPDLSITTLLPLEGARICNVDVVPYGAFGSLLAD